MKREELFIRKHLGRKTKISSETINRVSAVSQVILDKDSTLAITNDKLDTHVQSDKKVILNSLFNTNNNGKHNHRPSSLEVEGNEMYMKGKYNILLLSQELFLICLKF